MRCAFALLLLSLPAFAEAPRVAVLSFPGPKGAFVREQLLAALCDRVECVAQGQVTSGKKGPDWKKVRANGVDGVLKGEVVKVRGKSELKLQLLAAPHKAAWATSLKLDRRGELAASEDKKLTSAIQKRLHGRPGSRDPASEPEAKPADDATELAKNEAPPAPRHEAKAAAVEAKPAVPERTAAASAPETAAASASSSTDSGRRYKPLPPELLSFTPRI